MMLKVISPIEQALIFISAAVVLVPIFQRLGFGSVLGYLVSGVLVGPHGFKLIGDSESIAHFSELGVVFLLFIIGLEIQPRKLWSMRYHLFGLGGLQIGFCTVVFSGFGLALGLPLAAAIVVGFALSLSSTAYAVQTMMEKNVFNTEFGRAGFSILLAQDLVAIPALAVIPLLAVSDSAAHEPHVSIWFALVLIGLLVFASRFLIRPVFRMIAATRSREIFTGVTLFIVIGVAVLMQKMGLSAALGTFIAGVLLADSEYRHELETNIEPFKGLLMGLFFIAVGMGVSTELIANEPLKVLSLTLAYLLAKGLVIYGVGRLSKLNHGNAKCMALSIAQGGEFAFVIFGLVTTLGIISAPDLSLLTAVITLSMAFSPLIAMLDEKLALHRKKEIDEPAFDEINEVGQVIIAGFGRFGQIFGRILRAQNIPFIAIDHDQDQIELLRKFGSTVYYGDASRQDLLEAAGAAQAKYLILAIDDTELSLKTAALVREHFPHLKIFARARNRGHAYDLMELGVKFIKRETFDSSVFFTRDLLVEMGFEKSKADRMVEKFRKHDEIMLQEQFLVRSDTKSLVSLSKQAAMQLAQVLNEDQMQSHIELSPPPPPSPP